MISNLRDAVTFSLSLLAGCAAAPPKAPDTPTDSTVASIAPLPADGQPAAGGQPSAPVAAPTDANVEAATTAAKAWLLLVDDGKYADSWSSGAKAFQNAVSSENWAKAVGGVRAPLGKPMSRQLRSAEFKTSLPGVPDGKYVVIQFATAFEKKTQAVETVTPSLEADGAWKVSGYFIK